MILLRIVFLFLLFPVIAHARSLNYIESHLLRLSSQQNPEHWFLPFSFLKKTGKVESNVMGSAQKDVLNLYGDIKTRDQQKIQERLKDSFGKPYDASGKINLGFRGQNFSQFFSANAGAVLLVTDPVFPELKGLLFNDYTGTTAYAFKPTPATLIRTQVSYGMRRILDRQYTTADLVQKSLNVNFNKQPYKGFAEMSFMGMHAFDRLGRVFFELNSFPVMNSKYQYWDTFAGYLTPSFVEPTSMWSELTFYAGYSPFYAGKYDVNRTFKVGMRNGLGEHVSLDLFTLDKFYPGALLNFAWTNFEVSAFTFERSYDDFGLQKSRQYGLNLRFKW